MLGMVRGGHLQWAEWGIKQLNSVQIEKDTALDIIYNPKFQFLEQFQMKSLANSHSRYSL